MTPQQFHSEAPDHVIDALLAPSEPVSIIDGLLDLPDGLSPGNELDRALRARLETRLARRMRHVIEVKSHSTDMG